MQKWEYRTTVLVIERTKRKVITRTNDGNSLQTSVTVDSHLQRLGLEGWELVGQSDYSTGIETLLIFKRPL